jgi:hypothetical protein
VIILFTKLWSLKLSDSQRAFIIAVISVPLSLIYDSIMAGSFTFDWRAIIRAAIIGAISYIIKNFGTGINGNVLTDSTKSVITGQETKGF